MAVSPSISSWSESRGISPQLFHFSVTAQSYSRIILEKVVRDALVGAFGDAWHAVLCLLDVCSYSYCWYTSDICNYRSTVHLSRVPSFYTFYINPLHGSPTTLTYMSTTEPSRSSYRLSRNLLVLVTGCSIRTKVRMAETLQSLWVLSPLILWGHEAFFTTST